MNYIHQASPLLNGITFWSSPYERWNLICKTLERQQDSKYVLDKIDLLKKLHQEDRERRNADFKNNKESKRGGDTQLSLDAQRLKKQKKK